MKNVLSKVIKFVSDRNVQAPNLITLVGGTPAVQLTLA